MTDEQRSKLIEIEQLAGFLEVALRPQIQSMKQRAGALDESDGRALEGFCLVDSILSRIVALRVERFSARHGIDLLQSIGRAETAPMTTTAKTH